MKYLQEAEHHSPQIIQYLALLGTSPYLIQFGDLIELARRFLSVVVSGQSITWWLNCTILRAEGRSALRATMMTQENVFCGRDSEVIGLPDRLPLQASGLEAAGCSSALDCYVINQRWA